MAQGEDCRNWNFVSFLAGTVMAVHGQKPKSEINPYYIPPEPMILNAENAKYIRSFFERG